MVRSKRRREREKYREDARKEDDALFLKVNEIYIDGRKDATLVMVNKENKLYRRGALCCCRRTGRILCDAYITSRWKRTIYCSSHILQNQRYVAVR